MTTIYRLLVVLLLISSAKAGDQEFTISVNDTARCVECSSNRKNMSLTCKWYTVNVSDCPVSLSNVGILTRAAGCIVYSAAGSVIVKSELDAVELNFALYDVFNQHLITLRSSDVIELPVGSFELDAVKPPFAGRWDIPSYVDPDELLIVIAFPEKARLRTGEIWQIDYHMLTKKIQEIVPTAKFEPDSARK